MPKDPLDPAIHSAERGRDRQQGAETLVAEGAWLRRLARRLVADSHLAEDAVQETLVAAWRRGGPWNASSARPSRSWLAHVLRNFLRQGARSDARRSEREALAAQPERYVQERSTLERLELQRRVVDAVEALEEPYRTTLVLRFLDDLTPRAIAARTDTPVKTVHTRIERGLAKLRSRLDDVWRDGRENESPWRHALLALPGVAAPTATILTGAMAMGSMTKLVGTAAAAVVLVAGAALVFGPEDEVADPGILVAAEGGAAVELREGESDHVADATDARGRRAAVSSPAAPPRPASVVRTLSGLVVDIGDRPVPGVRVTIISGHDLEEARSGANGAFTIALPEAVAEELANFHDPSRSMSERSLFFLAADDPDWIGLASAEIPGRWTGLVSSDTPGTEPVVVVAPATELSGVVVDADDRPVAGARVHIDYPVSLAFHLQAEGRHVPPRRVETETDAEGYFALERLPVVDGAFISAGKDGFRGLRQALALPSPDAHVLRLERTLPGERTIEGRVLTSSGEPFAGAMVSAESYSVVSDEEGWFAVQLPEPAESSEQQTVELCALAQGLLPARQTIDCSAPLPSFVELRLGQPSLAISGRVSDAAGAPVEGALVWVSDLTFFGFVVEHEIGISIERHRYAEELTRPIGEFPQGVFTYSGADGTFRIDGLLERDYPLAVIDEDTLAFTEAGSVPAGSSGLELTVQPEVPAVPVAGHVFGRSGEPIAGAFVIAKSVQHDRSGLPYRGLSVTTDATGHFAFDALVPEDLVLVVGGAGIAYDSQFPIGLQLDLGGLELVVGRIARFKVSCEDPGLASATIRVRTAEDEAVQMMQEVSGQMFWSSGFQLSDGVSGIIEVDDAAETLLVEVGGRDPVRVPLQLDPTRVVEVTVP